MQLGMVGDKKDIFQLLTPNDERNFRNIQVPHKNFETPTLPS